MEQLVIVRSDAKEHFTAQIVGIPDLKAEGKTEAEAIAQIKHSLAALFESAKVVSIDVPVNGRGNPWIEGFGRSANDEDFAAYQEELQRESAAEDRQ